MWDVRCGISPFVFCLLPAFFIKSAIRNPESEFLNPLDYTGEDGNTFITWVEAHSTAIDC
jgi:hypothetical protein